MRRIHSLVVAASTFCLTACIAKGTNPNDPYESVNRKIHRFNGIIDTAVLKPAAITYKTLVPSLIRSGINNAYNNINLLPTVANDLLQGQWSVAYKDSWRFIANSTMGIGGVLDVASRFSLPPHSNDLGLTFAKWGDKHSPYIVIPLMGPSTIRDGMGMMFDYTLFTPYPYLKSNAAIYSLLGVRYVDLRSQMFETDRLINEAVDQYAFIRDAYLQHRNYLITGEQQESGELYVDEDEATTVSAPIDTPPSETPSPNRPEFPITTSMITPSAKRNQHATHRTPAA